MSNVPVSTEGRIFAKHVVKDARQREQAGANLLSPGASNWRQALETFGMAMSKSGSPIHAGKVFAAGRERHPHRWPTAAERRASAASGAVQRAPADGWVLPLDGLSLSGDIPNP
jgi:hypothetical protein